jgi:hypothetical protein
MSWFSREYTKLVPPKAPVISKSKPVSCVNFVDPGKVPELRAEELLMCNDLLMPKAEHERDEKDISNGKCHYNTLGMYLFRSPRSVFEVWLCRRCVTLGLSHAVWRVVYLASWLFCLALHCLYSVSQLSFYISLLFAILISLVCELMLSFPAVQLKFAPSKFFEFTLFTF